LDPSFWLDESMIFLGIFEETAKDLSYVVDDGSQIWWKFLCHSFCEVVQDHDLNLGS
jgi:hypothetical protein